jgi:restriction system protein
MPRGRHSSGPRILVVLDALGKIWLLLALWAFYPLITSIVSQWLIGLMLSPITHQPPSFAAPEVWVIPQAMAWLELVTALLVVTWLWGVLTAGQRRATGKRLEDLRSMTPHDFEHWVGARFRDLGYKVRNTGKSGDHGIDLVANRGNEKVVVQCKRYRHTTVGEPEVRDLYGAMQHEAADRAYLVTTGRFTAAAIAWTKGKPIELWDGQNLGRLGFATPDPVPIDSGQVSPKAPANPLAPRCPRCESRLVEKRNRRTREAFLGCAGYPNCRYTRPLAPAIS